MKKINIVIIALLALGLCGLALMEGYIKPGIRKKEEQYLAEQGDPLTHDFSRILKYRSRYMGDVSNLANLNADLPLSDFPRTFQLYPETLMAEINFQGPAKAIEKALFNRILLYNATANFVLVDNLEVLLLNFEDSSYSITRSAVEDWYSVELASLQEEAEWTERVQQPLSDGAYVNAFIEKNIRTR